MTPPQFHKRGRLDRPFKMQMELSLRGRKDEAGGLRRHEEILKDQAIW